MMNNLKAKLQLEIEQIKSNIANRKIAIANFEKELAEKEQQLEDMKQQLEDMKPNHGWDRVKDGERYYHIIETDKGFEVYSRREGRYAVDENGFNNNNYNTNEDTLCGVSDIFNMIMAEVKKWEVEKNKLMHYESLKNRIKTLGVWGVK